MALTLNHLASETALNTLNQLSRQQQKSMEKLTSGLSINHASDNAAGLSVVTNMTTQIRGMAIASQNANDGINLLQTADGALDDSTNLLQRMRELSIQAMNGTYTSAQRADMNAEFQHLNQEISRIAQVTKFNNLNVFAVSHRFQVGWEVGDTNKVTMSAFSLASVVGADVLTAGNASVAVGMISAKMQSIQTRRAKWGALVNRLDSTILNLNNMSENTQTARSRLWDTDYAKEFAQYVKTQILQQVAISMLSQANKEREALLSLLR